MLQRNCIIGKAISGLDPDHDLADMGKDEDRWLRDHPEKPKISEEMRERRRKNMKKIRRGNNPIEKDANRIQKSDENKQSA